MEMLLNLLIEPAYAQDAPAGGGIVSFLPLVLIFVLFYFLLIRPQQKRAKEHQAMITALATGDEVVSGGGVLGKITDVGEQFVTVEVAKEVKVKMQKHTITTVLPKGTIKGG